MSNQVHRNKFSSLSSKLVKEIDSLPLHPKNKLLLYSRNVLCIVPRHSIVEDKYKTCVNENLDNLVCKYVRQ